MNSKYPRPVVGLQCSVTGTVIGKPLAKMVKNGTVPMLGMTVSYVEYDGSTSFCRATLFGSNAPVLTPQITPGQRVTVEGTGSLSSWEKNGEKQHGFAILAQSVRLVGDEE